MKKKKLLNQNNKKYLINTFYKLKVKKILKQFKSIIKLIKIMNSKEIFLKKYQKLVYLLTKLISYLDKMCKKKIFKKKTVSKLKSKYSKIVQTLI